MHMLAKIRSRFTQQPQVQPDTVIHRSDEVVGTLTLAGVTRIDGAVEGRIQSTGMLVISDGARVKAEVYADHAVIAGEVTGNVHCSGTLVLTASARVNGDVEAATIQMDPGAALSGNCSIHAAVRSTQEASPSRPSLEERMRAVMGAD